jgi:hypothetical protein
MRDAKQGRQPEEGGDAYLRGYHKHPDTPTEGFEPVTVNEAIANAVAKMPPPSDAAPVLQNDVLNYLWGQATLGDKYAEGLANRMEAHPDDAPGGPWELKESPNLPGQWIVTSGKGCMYTARRVFTKDQMIAVRDALNRFKGDEK